MSTAQEPQVAERPEPSADEIQAYLKAHPEFFAIHPEWLDGAQIAAQTDDVVVSLAERRLQSLRERAQRSERQLREFIANARANQTLADKIHALILTLLAPPGRAARLAEIVRGLHEEFAVEYVHVLLFAAPADDVAQALTGRLRVIAPDVPEAATFRGLLEATQPHCGRLSRAQREFLFGDAADAVESAALLPLRTPGGSSMGLLLMGSRSEDQFPPGSGAELLQRIADLTAAVLRA